MKERNVKRCLLESPVTLSSRPVIRLGPQSEAAALTVLLNCLQRVVKCKLKSVLKDTPQLSVIPVFDAGRDPQLLAQLWTSLTAHARHPDSQSIRACSHPEPKNDKMRGRRDSELTETDK
ncbi:hypothetical protein STEG23_023023, partial [Scotinomys teguina]